MVARTASGEREGVPDRGVRRDASPQATSYALPGGVVTFVMTDIEGSTRLFRRLGDDYADLLAAHNALLRMTFTRHGGVEVGTEGDSLLVAFADASEAVASCLDAQLALAAHDWPVDAEVRVRMGAHTGDATPVDGDYVSLAVHQVARICAGAHGGQVLVSEATAAAATQLPSHASLVALGSFQLRGFPAPARLFQLKHPTLRSEFPPLRAIGVVAHNLPFFRSSFVGRGEDRAALAELLRTTGVVTLVGLGGVGKTRLAVQVAFDVMDRFADGAWLVELASLTDPAAPARAISATMGIPEQPGQDLEEVIGAALREKATLLIIDNCEHLLANVAPLVEHLSHACPHLVVLATSREPLDIEGEIVWRLDPLPTPDPDQAGGLDGIAAADAVRLFIQRAALVSPGFRLSDANAADVARVVARLNGIPLAIELAAAAVGERSLAGVLRGLDDRFELLAHGRRTAPGRHQTLRAALEWSLDLLGTGERRLFARLAAFAGSGTTEAAIAICAGDPVPAGDVTRIIRHLRRASLLAPHPEARERWLMLESIRELAVLELAAAGETDTMAQRHRTWYADHVEAIEPHLGRRGHAALMRELAADHDNVRRAIDTAVTAGDTDLALRICVAMTPFWTSHGSWTEGARRFQAAMALDGGDDALRTRARAAMGNLVLLRGELDEAEELFGAAERSAAVFSDEVVTAQALAGLGYVAFRRSRLGEAEERWERALASAERAGDDRVIASVLRSLAIASGSRGRQQQTGALLERALAAAKAAGDDQLVRLVLGSLGEMLLWLGRYRDAEDAYGEALDLATEIGDLSARPLLLAELGWLAYLRGDPQTAHRLSMDAVELAEDLENPRVLAHALRLGGEVQGRRGTLGEAAALFDRALAVAEELGAPAELAGVRCSQACLALDERRFDEARALAEAALELSTLGHTMRRTAPGWVLGVVALRDDDLDRARRRFDGGLAEAVYADIPRHQANNIWGLGRLSAASGRTGEALHHHGRALELRRSISDRFGVADSLTGVAEAVAALEPERALQLVAAATAIRRTGGAAATAREAAEAHQIMASVSAADVAGGTGADQVRGAALDEHAAIEEATRIVTRYATAPAGHGGTEAVDDERSTSWDG